MCVTFPIEFISIRHAALTAIVMPSAPTTTTASAATSTVYNVVHNLQLYFLFFSYTLLFQFTRHQFDARILVSERTELRDRYVLRMEEEMDKREREK